MSRKRDDLVMSKTTDDKIKAFHNQVHKKLLQLVKEHETDLSEVSKKIGKNHAYLQQFLKYGRPTKLPEDVRMELANVFQVDKDVFKGPKIRKMERGLLTKKPDPGNLKFDELSIRAGTKNSLSIDAGQQAIVGSWSLPRNVIENRISKPENIRIIQVTGDGMLPELSPGDRIMVDLADITPSPPGLFVIWDGMEFVVKRCAVVPSVTD